MKKLIASFQMSVQVTEDTWSLRRYNTEIASTTTIEEISSWTHSKGVGGPVDITISEMDSLIPTEGLTQKYVPTEPISPNPFDDPNFPF